MKTVILNNLRTEIDKNIENKLQVVYILVQIRKLLELEEQQDSFEVLNLFCNWALHPKLSWGSTKRLFESKVEPFIERDLSYEEIKTKLSETNRFFDFTELKNEISSFLSSFDLESSTIKPWKTFVKLLLEVLEECPVEYESEKIKKLSIEDIETTPTFRIHLKFKLNNGKNIIKVKLKNI